MSGSKKFGARNVERVSCLLLVTLMEGKKWKSLRGAGAGKEKIGGSNCLQLVCIIDSAGIVI